MVAHRPLVLSPGEWAVLGAISEGPTHGFAVAQLMAPQGDLGRIWTLPRPIVYQAIKKLVQLGLVAARSEERSDRGPLRTVMAVTPAGRRELRRWLAEPVDHVRDVRSMLLLKLALLDRAKRDPLPLIRAQEERLVHLVEALGPTRTDAEGFERVLAEWRLASSEATLSFLKSITTGR